MKLKYIKNLFLVAALGFLAACDPVVDEAHLKNNSTIDGVELIATQNDQNGNTIELKMNTPGITGYWDYNLGTAFTDRVEIIYPIPGTSTFTFVGTLGEEFFEKTIDVTVDVLDTRLDQDWYDLVSENTSGGKTWVYAGDPFDGGLWWYMSPPGGPENAYSVWWNAAGECCPPADAAGKMTFDLDGAANYKHYPDASSDAHTSGSFVLDVENKKLTISGASLLGGGTEGECGFSVFETYDIISLTEDELILYIPSAPCGSGWTYVFKAQ